MTRAQRERFEGLQVSAEALRRTLEDIQGRTQRASTNAAKAEEEAAALQGPTQALRHQNHVLKRQFGGRRLPFSLMDRPLWWLGAAVGLGGYVVFGGSLLSLVVFGGVLALVVCLLVLAVTGSASS